MIADLHQDCALCHDDVYGTDAVNTSRGYVHRGCWVGEKGE